MVTFFSWTVLDPIVGAMVTERAFATSREMRASSVQKKRRLMAGEANIGKNDHSIIAVNEWLERDRPRTAVAGTATQ